MNLLESYIREALREEFKKDKESSLVLENKEMMEKFGSKVSSVLDIVGWIPGYGSIASGVNAIWNLYKKKYIVSICYIISMVPGKGKFIGSMIKKMYGLLSPYYKRWKAGDLDFEEILDDPTEEIVNLALFALSNKTKVMKVFYLFVDKEEVKDETSDFVREAVEEAEKFFEFLQEIKNKKEEKEAKVNDKN